MAPAAQASPALAADWRGRRLDELPRITRETLLTREESLRLTKLKFDQGVSSALDLRLAESLTEGAGRTGPTRAPARAG